MRLAVRGAGRPEILLRPLFSKWNARKHGQLFFHDVEDALIGVNRSSDGVTLKERFVVQKAVKPFQDRNELLSSFSNMLGFVFFDAPFRNGDAESAGCPAINMSSACVPTGC